MNIDILGLDNFMEIEDTEEIEQNEQDNEDEKSLESTSEEEILGSVTSEEQDTEKENETDEASTSSPNVYTSLAKALTEEDILSGLDLKNKTINNWEDFRTIFEEQIESKVNSRLDEQTKLLKEAISNGADVKKISEYSKILDNISGLTEEDLKDESDEGFSLRQNIIYQDFLNNGISPERAKKKLEKIIERGEDVEEAIESLESNKDYYKTQIEKLNLEAREKTEKEKTKQEEFYKDLYSSIEKDREPIKGIKISEDTSKKILNTLKKSVSKDDNGKPINAIQKYAKENPKDFQKVIGTLFTITDGFTDFDKIMSGTKKIAKKQVIRDLESKIFDNPIGLTDNELNLEERKFGRFGKDFDLVL